MYLTGFTDEASADFGKQIAVTKELGWNAIDARSIDGVNIHDLPVECFDEVCAELEEAGIFISCFGSEICNWACDVQDNFEPTFAQVKRSIERMKRLNTRMIRIMSFKVDPQAKDQMTGKRFELLREICVRFVDAGITPLHENCKTYGGMSWQHSLELVEKVPGLKLVFDTGGPVFKKDMSKPGDVWQDSWEFYSNIKEHVLHIHIKDGLRPEPSKDPVYTYPGEGVGCVLEILKDLHLRGYSGGIAMEPHVAKIFHQGGMGDFNENAEAKYLEYGRRLMEMLKSIGYQWKPYEA